MKPWKPLARRVYEHSPYLRIEDVDCEAPDGRRVTFSLTAGKPTVCILALTSDLRVVLARQYRPGPDLVLDELPGGVVNDGEGFEAAVRRELLEETGYIVHRLVPLGRFHECAYSRIERQGFLALGCERREDQKLDHSEEIEVVLKPLAEFVTQIRKGLCTDAEVAWAGLMEAGLVGAKV